MKAHTWNDVVNAYAEKRRHPVHARCHCDVCAAVRVLDPYLGGSKLQSIHNGHKGIQRFRVDARAKGLRGKTINLRLEFVTRLLRMASRELVDEKGRPWLDTARFLTREATNDSKRRRPLSWDEQAILEPLLPPHARRFLVLATNMGLRMREILALRWEWLREEDGITYFEIPGRVMKMGEPVRYPCNSTVRALLAGPRESAYVVSYQGERIGNIRSSAFLRARDKAGIPDIDVHSLKHTVGYRLRDRGVALETIRELLCHRPASVSEWYARPSLRELAAGIETIARRGDPCQRKDPHSSG